MDISASLFSWIQLTKCVTDSGFIDVRDCMEFVKAFYKLFPEIKKITTNDFKQKNHQNEREELKTFLYSVLRSIPEDYKPNIPLIDVDSFMNCVPDFLEEITKAFLFSMNLWKRDELMEQLNRLQYTERNDLFSLLYPKKEKDETNDLISLANQMRNYAKQLELSIKYDNRINELTHELSREDEKTNTTKENATKKQLEILKNHKNELHKKRKENENIQKEIDIIEDKIENIEKELEEKGENTMKLSELARENINLRSSHSFITTSIELIKSSPLFSEYSDIEEEMKSKEDMIETLKIQKENIQNMIETTNNQINEYNQLENEIKKNEEKIEQNLNAIKKEKETGTISKLLEQLKEEKMKNSLLLETPKNKNTTQQKNIINYFFILFIFIAVISLIYHYIL